MTNSRETLDVRQLLDQMGAQHLLGSLASSDLNVNLVTFTGEDGIEEHTNNEVDVLVVAMHGTGVLTIDGEETRLETGHAVIIPKGSARSIRANGERFAYLTCHRRRQGLMPKPFARRT